MQIVAKEAALRDYLKTAVEIDADKPVLVDKYIRGKEVEVDAICDGKQVFVPGIMELVERTGVHSGDSISIYPTYSISEKVKNTILDYTQRLGLGIGIVGLNDMGFNIEATIGTALFLKEHGIRTRIRPKLSEGSEEILQSIRAGYVSYVICTRAILSGIHYEDGVAIRRCASQNNITMLTSLDTVKMLLEVLEEVTIGISKIDDE